MRTIAAPSHMEARILLCLPRLPAPFSPAAVRRAGQPQWASALNRHMEARLKLKPGQNGTKKLLARFGERLVCVRYRYDEPRSLPFTTVELLVSTYAYQPRQTTPLSPP